MPSRNHRKRAVLFLAAVLLPSAVLVGTTLRLIRQQRELAVRRTEEERAVLALRVGQGLLEEFRKVGDRLAGVSMTPEDIDALTDSEPAILTLASAWDGQLVFPWEMRPGLSSAPDPTSLARYSRLLDRGGEAEYREGSFYQAARAYGQAADGLEAEARVDGTPPEVEAGASLGTSALVAEARVHQARALLRAERTDEARAVFLLLAKRPPFLVDRDGMPFSLYGLEGLLRSGVKPEDLHPFMESFLAGTPHFALPALLAWRDVALEIAGAVDEPSGGLMRRSVEESVASGMETLEALEDLRTDFPSLLAVARRTRGSGETTGGAIWVPYGKEPWMVGILSAEEEGRTPVAVIRPLVLLGSAVGPGVSEAGTEGVEASDETFQAAWRNLTLLPAGESEGQSLGPSLNGLRGSFPSDFPSFQEGGTVEGWFYRLLLPLILILTGLTAYMAWRDVRRETEAVRLRSQFVSSVTHELKTPLTSIRMFVETLRLGRHSSQEMQQEYLDTVVHETERLSRLINNVLDFARIDRGEKTYHMAPTVAGAVAREAARVLAYPLAQGGYTLTTEIAEDLPNLDADADALAQALLNLLSNAIKFSGEGSRIDLRVFRAGEDVLFQVEDRGPGIALRDQEAIFRDFFRTADAEREGIPGTGLGLPLVAHVAAAHGGRVEVGSALGKGSIFTLRIPVEGRTS